MAARDTQFDTKLLIFRFRQVALSIIVLIAICSFTLFIHKGLAETSNLLIVLLPLSLISSVFIIFPPTEEWEYRAWQSKAQRVEQQSSGR